MTIYYDDTVEAAKTHRNILKFKTGAVVPLPGVKVHTSVASKHAKECLMPLFRIKNGKAEAFITLSERESFDRALVLGLMFLLRDNPDIEVRRCFEPKEQKPLLRAAGAFAVCFLMPKELIKEDLVNRTWTVAELAKKYDVLPHIVRLRLVGLGLWDSTLDQPKCLVEKENT